ncbi:MAG: hypothetical protein R3325_07250, partial [Thermoanaerobaculia bacterium]|nr:hypothetical protein [Thermoanaerobaculia bacterium]
MSRRRPGAPAATLPLPLLVALRYLRSTRRDAFVSFLSLTAAGGLAVGTAALILALAALTGFQSLLKRELLSRTPEIEVELPAGADPAAAAAAAESVEGVRAAQPLLRGQGWLITAGRARPVELVGFADRLPDSFPDASSRAPGLYVSDRVAELDELAPGTRVELASGRPVLTPFGPQPRVRRLAVAGRFASGATEVEDRVALPLAEAERLLGRSGYRLVVSTGDLDTALVLAPELGRRLPEGSRVSTWRDLNRGLFFALRLEKSLMFVAVFLIVLVAALALVSDLTLIIASKRPEIGMLGAMGAGPRTIERVFVLLGAL